MILKQVIHFPATNSVEATWVEVVTPEQIIPATQEPDTVDADGNVIPGAVIPEQVIPAVEQQVRCHSYDQTQMDMLLADIGGVAGDYQHIFDAVAAGFIPPDASLVAQQRRNEIISRLNQIDILSIRALRAKMTNRGKPADDTKLAALEAEADALRAELATL